MSVTARDQLIHLVARTELAQDIGAFLIDREARGLSARTVRFYGDELSYLRGFMEAQGIREVHGATPTHLRQYLLHLSGTRNPGGIHAAYRAIRAFFRWCWIEYDIQSPNPITKVRPPKVVQQPLEPLPLPDLQAMLKTCERRTFTGDRDRALLLSLLDTGCRASEFVALNVCDVNLHTGAVLIRAGKGGKSRTTFVGAKSRRELSRYFRQRKAHANEALWLTVQGTRLTYWGLRQIIRRRAERAGVPVPSLHSFRRAFALYALRNGADIYSLQRLMGHSDLTVLRRYLKQTEADLREAHRRAGPVDNLL